MQLIAVPTLEVVPAAAWDKLGDDNYPFMEHAFLRGMEVSGTVGEQTGWTPLYLLVTSDFETKAAPVENAPTPVALPEGATLFGAAACYLKTDSYGEFIFDWAWASFFHRQGVAYYPKLVVAAPFTPATGPRVMVAPDLPVPQRAKVNEMLGKGVIALAQQLGASSAHWLFTRPGGAQQLSSVGYHHRLTIQHAWLNRGYKSFDDFLATMKSRKRKAIRRERRLANQHGLQIDVFRGCEMSDIQWAALRSFYVRGCYRYGSTPYLSALFFDWLRDHFADRVLSSMAWDPAAGDDGRWVAATLNFQRGQHLYGRYWGCEREYYALHFEMAFYRLIELCIERGWQRFEAGAGGRHKIKRGLEPVHTHSAHWIAHPQLSHAVYQHIADESQHMQLQRTALNQQTNRREDSPPQRRKPSSR